MDTGAQCVDREAKREAVMRFVSTHLEQRYFTEGMIDE